MVNWQALEGIGGVATAAAVVFAVVFGVVQFRQIEAQRRQAATQHYLTAFTSPGVAEATQRLLALPDGAPAETIASNPQLVRDVVNLDWVVEGVGALVYTRVIDLHDFDRIAGGFVRGVWRKIEPYVQAERGRAHWPNLGEWWQWLVDRLEEDPLTGKQQGAHIAFRNWKR